MSKLINDDCMDAAFAECINNATTLHLASGDPTTRAAAITNSLADAPLDPTGDWTFADGDTSGRKVTLRQQTDVPIDTSGTAAVVCVIDGSRLLLKTDLSSTQAITSGGTVTINAFDWEILDAA